MVLLSRSSSCFLFPSYNLIFLTNLRSTTRLDDLLPKKEKDKRKYRVEAVIWFRRCEGNSGSEPVEGDSGDKGIVAVFRYLQITVKITTLMIEAVY